MSLQLINKSHFLLSLIQILSYGLAYFMFICKNQRK